MGDHSPIRVVLLLLALLAFLFAFMLNTLTSFGESSGVFKQSTEDVFQKYTTAITPAGWSFFVWDFSYVWLLSMFVYFLVCLCRRKAYAWMYTTPAVLPYGFHISLIINICLNISWLLLFDREYFTISTIVSALMTLTNYMILVFSCHGLKVYGAWLNKYHNVDLWLIRILVQNGIAMYATWGTICTLLNLTIVLHHQTQTPKAYSALLSLLLLLLELLAWFLLENFYLDEHVRYIVTVYPVIILMLAGIVCTTGCPDSDITLFTAVILAVSCTLFVARIGMVRWRHRKQPLYKDNEQMLSPMEISLTQRRVFT